MGRVALFGAIVCLTSALTSAQTTSTTQTKSFEVISVDGNTLVVKLPEGTKELTVPDTFRFSVDGSQLSVHQLRAGMNGTAQITTTTKSTPVTVTEVKNGSVVMVSGSNIYVRTAEGVKMFSQRDVDKRGVQIVREGKPAQVSDFRAGDTLSATIITTRPPTVVTERQVQATLAREAAPVAAAPRPAPAPPPAVAEAPAPRPSPAPETQLAQTLPHTAGSLPSIALLGMVSLLAGVGLGTRRRRRVR